MVAVVSMFRSLSFSLGGGRVSFSPLKLVVVVVSRAVIPPAAPEEERLGESHGGALLHFRSVSSPDTDVRHSCMVSRSFIL